MDEVKADTPIEKKITGIVEDYISWYAKLSERSRKFFKLFLAVEDVRKNTPKELQKEINELYQKEQRDARDAFQKLEGDYDQELFEKLLENLEDLRFKHMVAEENMKILSNRFQAQYDAIMDYMDTRKSYSGTMKDTIKRMGIKIG